MRRSAKTTTLVTRIRYLIPAARNRSASSLLARALLGLLAAVCLCAQEAGPTPVAAPIPYLPLRYDEDWSALRDPALRSDWLDRLKFIPLNANESDYLTLGGEIRETYERFHNPDFGLSPQGPDGYLLQRYLFDADLHLGAHFRVFAQLQSGLENGRTGGPRLMIDEDRLDLNHFFST